MNAALKLFEAGQSVWYDNIQRNLLKNGEMAGMIQRGEIRGVTSNPTIFMNAIGKSQDYDDSLKPLAGLDLSMKQSSFAWQLKIFNLRRIFSSHCTRKVQAGMDMSAWKSALTWLKIPRER